MKLFKKSDLTMQVLLIVGFMSWFCFNLFQGKPGSFLVFDAYLWVGGWQVGSCIIHTFLQGHFYKDKTRSTYGALLLFLLVAAFVTIPFWIFYIYTLLFVAPLLACWYMVICYREIILLEKKSFIHLKR